jgi:hypothetical protein
MQLRGWYMAIAAAIAGIAGTVVFDLMGLMAGQGWSVPESLAGALGAGIAAGAILHYAIGALLAIIFAGLIPLFFGPLWLRAMQFITVQVVFGVWLFMMPLMGAGPLGLEMGAMMPVMSLVSHWAFAVVMAFTYQAIVKRWDAAAAETGAGEPAVRDPIGSV